VPPCFLFLWLFFLVVGNGFASFGVGDEEGDGCFVVVVGVAEAVGEFRFFPFGYEDE